MQNPSTFLSTVDVICQDSVWEEHEAFILVMCENITKATLRAVGVHRFTEHALLSVVLTDNAAVQKLNARYRHIQKPTNVLSFPNFELTAGRYASLPSTAELGDVILAYGVIAEEAKEQEKKFEDHVAHLVVHGVLHLLGYDHTDDDDAQRMEMEEIKILKEHNIPNPYE